MKNKIWILLFLVIACQAKNEKNIKNYDGKINFTKGVELKVGNKGYNNVKYINLEKFNDKYSYWDVNNEYLKMSLINTGNRELDKYIRFKEKNLKSYKFGEELLEFKSLTQEEKVIQMVKLLIEMRKKEIPLLLANDEYINNMSLMIFGSYIENYLGKLGSKDKKFYEILEKNFNIEDIEMVLRYLTYNSEFGNYETEKRYNLAKVDSILEKLSNVSGISEEEWMTREAKQNDKIFENEVGSILGFIYLLKDNRILVTNGNKKILKEIKVTDYKDTDIAVYKGIFYVYDNGKVYEYSLKNLNEIKRYDVN
jgi:hypothetical protein